MNLTDLSYYFRKYLPHAIIAFIVLLIFYYSAQLFIRYITYRPTSIYINPVFGKLNKPEVKDLIKTDFYFTLDTVAGKPETATASAKVISIPPTSAGFGYREKVYLMARTFGFDTEKIKYELEDDNKAVFKDENQSLSVDIANFNFDYSYNYENRAEIFDNTIIPQPKEIENKAIDVLTKADRYPEELSKGKIIIDYYHYDPSTKKMNIVLNPNDANLASVNFLRPDIDNFQVVPPHYFNSQNNVLLVFYADQIKILKAEVNFFEKSTAELGIYPIKTGDQAWAKLASGEAMIVNAPQKKDIAIKKMFMGYLDPDYYQPYLQPIYVFLGDNNFVAYVPAVTDEYLGE